MIYVEKFDEFCVIICKSITKATKKEKADISQEISEHMQDRFEMLTEMGYSEVEAIEATVAGMGDPVEIGTEINKNLSWVWSVINCLANVCFMLVFIVSINVIFDSSGAVLDGIKARNGDEISIIDEPFSGDHFTFTDSDIELSVRNSAVSVLGYGISEIYENKYELAVYTIGYAYDMSGYVPNHTINSADLEKVLEWKDYQNINNLASSKRVFLFVVEPSMSEVTLTCDIFEAAEAEVFEFTIPLDWSDKP